MIPDGRIYQLESLQARECFRRLGKLPQAFQADAFVKNGLEIIWIDRVGAVVARQGFPAAIQILEADSLVKPGGRVVFIQLDCFVIEADRFFQPLLAVQSKRLPEVGGGIAGFQPDRLTKRLDCILPALQVGIIPADVVPGFLVPGIEVKPQPETLV